MNRNEKNMHRLISYRDEANFLTTTTIIHVGALLFRAIYPRCTSTSSLDYLMSNEPLPPEIRMVSPETMLAASLRK